MRWTKRPAKSYPPLNTRRSRRGFLWLPLGIEGETRWLERAAWVERFADDFGHNPEYAHWKPERWQP